MVLYDIKGNPLLDCDIVECKKNRELVVLKEGGKYYAEGLEIEQADLNRLRAVKQSESESFAVRRECPSPCNQCRYPGCNETQFLFPPEYFVIGRYCPYYAEYYLMKLKHRNERNL